MVTAAQASPGTLAPGQTASGKLFDPAEVLPWLPCTLVLEATVVGFTVGSLLRLREGSLVTTAVHQSSDLPLRVNGILMAWTEFEVVGERLAARITDLA
jgi:flagellar motor switch/type III secretory pathway protein FliN